MAQQQQYTSATTKNTLTRIEYALDEHGLKVPAAVLPALAALGFSEDQTRIAIAMCLATNIELESLQAPVNLPVIKNAYMLMTEYGYRPGLEFYVYGFKDDTIGTKKLALVRSIDCLMQRAQAYAALQGIAITTRSQTIMDPEKAEVMLRYSRTLKHENHYRLPGIRVTRSRVQIVGEQYGPEDDWQIGSFVPDVLGSDGKVAIYYDGNSIRVGNANRQPSDVATTRAQRKALRNFCRTDYPLDSSPIEARIAKSMAFAETRILAALQSPDGIKRLTGSVAIGSNDALPDETEFEEGVGEEIEGEVAAPVVVVQEEPKKKAEKVKPQPRTTETAPKKQEPQRQVDENPFADSDDQKDPYATHPILDRLPEAQRDIIERLHGLAEFALRDASNKIADLQKLRVWLGALINIDLSLKNGNDDLLIDEAIKVIFGRENISAIKVPQEVANSLRTQMDKGNSDGWTLDTNSDAYLAIDNIGKYLAMEAAEPA